MNSCSECGTTLAPRALDGLCPKCLAATLAGEEPGAGLAGGDVFNEHELIGQGGMGLVFSAHDAALAREVALKRLRPEREQQPGARERFLAEAQIASQLEHPGIVPVYHAGIDAEGRPFYAMRRVRGCSLAEVLSRIGDGEPGTVAQYPLGTLLNVFQKVCDAVAYAHSRGVVHRDLKPENIMLGEFGEVLVMDWGLAKLLEEQEARGDGSEEAEAQNEDRANVAADVAQTLDHTIVGTPGFMAPELAEGRSRHADERSDIYALGAILYNILTLRAPIRGRDAELMIERAKSGDIRPPTDFNRGSGEVVAGKIPLPHCPNRRIPPGLSAIAMKAISLSPADRYQRVTEMQREVSAWENGFRPQAEGASALGDWLAFLRRHRTAAVVSSLFAGLLTMLIVQLAVGERRARAALVQLREGAPAFIAEAHSLIAVQQFTQALGRIDYALRLRPENGEYHRLRGDVLQTLLRFDEAAASYAEAIRLGANDPRVPANQALAKRLAAAGTNDGEIGSAALDELRSALLVQGRIDEALWLAAQIHSRNANALEEWNSTLANAGLTNRLKLRGTQLELDLRRSNLTNISFLRRLPLQRLVLSDNPVEDIGALRGMPLKELSLEDTRVGNLQPLAGMKLERLTVSRTKVKDLRPLLGMPLQRFTALEARITDLSPLQGLPLQVLNVYGNSGISDLRPLHGMRLRELDLYLSRVKDLAPLRGMPLENLNLCGTAVSDLEPLRGMPIRILNLSATPVTNISVLATLPLAGLFLHSVRVTDLGPLRGRPLQQLELHGCSHIRDVAPIALCRELEYLIVPASATNLTVLRGLPALKRIGYQINPSAGWKAVPTPDEFWRQFDASRRAR